MGKMQQAIIIIIILVRNSHFKCKLLFESISICRKVQANSKLYKSTQEMPDAESFKREIFLVSVV